MIEQQQHGHNNTPDDLTNLQSKSIHEAIQEYDDNQLLCYLQDIEINYQETRKEEMLEMVKGKPPFLFLRGEIDCTLLHLVLYQYMMNHRSKEIIIKLIDIGGKQLVMKKNDGGQTALHNACTSSRRLTNKNFPSADIVSKLIEV